MTVPLPVVRMVEVNIGSAPFATHSFSQGHRLLKLLVTIALPNDDELYKIRCTALSDGRVVPPGYYMVFAVNQGVPSVAHWVSLCPEIF